MALLEKWQIIHQHEILTTDNPEWANTYSHIRISSGQWFFYIGMTLKTILYSSTGIWQVGRSSRSAFPYWYCNNGYCYSRQWWTSTAFPDYATCNTTRQFTAVTLIIMHGLFDPWKWRQHDLSECPELYTHNSPLGTVPLCAIPSASPLWQFQYRWQCSSTFARCYLSESNESSNAYRGFAICERRSLLRPRKTANVPTLVKVWWHDIWGRRGIAPCFLTSAGDVGEWSDSRTGTFTPGTHWQVAGRHQSHSGYFLYIPYNILL
jgi:hypothetical protein